MKAKYRKLLAWLMGTDIYAYLLKHIIPYIRFSMYYTKIRGHKYHALYDRLEPGDVILSSDNRKLTTLLIPGEFSHASMCVSVSKPVENYSRGILDTWEVSEMTHHDYTKSAFFDICKESDRVVIMRYTEPNAEVISSAIARCKSFSYAEYDVEFDLGVKALYCSELIYQSYEDNALGANLDDLVGLGREYISPTGLYKAKHLVVVIDSDNL